MGQEHLWPSPRLQQQEGGKGGPSPLQLEDGSRARSIPSPQHPPNLSPRVLEDNGHIQFPSLYTLPPSRT